MSFEIDNPHRVSVRSVQMDMMKKLPSLVNLGLKLNELTPVKPLSSQFYQNYKKNGTTY